MQKPRGIRRLTYKAPSAETVELISHLMDRNCLIDFDDKQQLILRGPVALEIIRNNGQHTFLVHSTTSEHAQRVLEEGFVFQGAFTHPEIPDLQSSVMMLAGPQEINRKDLNVFGLVYHYLGRERDQLMTNSSKIVIELPIPYPGTIYAKNPFANTQLSYADGTMIVHESDEGEGRYRIPREYVKGYFNQTTGDFIANSHFNLKNHLNKTPDN